MNYLETGLPHTEFYPRKTLFSPPRFIPLCTLGRKYLGLDPLTKQEVNELVKRLSEPKKPIDPEETIPGNDVRPKSASSVLPGTGRFVGRKKMNGFEIEKMVERLYSRRYTKYYAFVDDEVTDEDIMNMTNRMDDADTSDSDNESCKDAKERENTIRRQSSAISGCSRIPSANVTRRQKPGIKYDSRKDNLEKPQSMSLKEDETHTDSVGKPRLDIQHRPSVTFQLETCLAENTRTLVGSRNASNQWRASDCVSDSKPKPILKRSVTVYGNSYMSQYGRSTQTARAEDKSGSVRCLRPKSEPMPMYAPRSEVIETTFTRIAPTKSTPSTPRLSSAKSVSAKVVHPDTPRSVDVNASIGTSSTAITLDADNGSKNHLPSIENKERKLPKYSDLPPDEHLIDRVAIYNRSPRTRCK